METITKLSGSLTTGTIVYKMTGRTSDGLSAAGYSAFVSSVTGSPPEAVKKENGDVTLLLTVSQVQKLQSWVNSQIMKSLLPGTKKPLDGKPSFDLGISPVLSPVLLKYALICGGIFFMSGFFVRGAIK